jgi:hypothetical protein
VSITGPGHSLQSFRSSHQESAAGFESIPVNALYHAGHELEPTVEQLLRDIRLRGIHFPETKDLHSPIRLSSSGELISSHSDGSLISIALRSILVDSLDWKVTWEKIKSSVGQTESSNRPLAQIHAFGPYSPSLFSGQGVRSDVIEIVDRSSVIDKSIPSWPPGSVAIVGMAVDFPGGSDKDAFWRVLNDKVNTVQSVSMILAPFVLCVKHSCSPGG